MQITDLINQMGGLQSVARELGVSPQQAQTGAAALLPAILGGFKKQAQAPTGLEGLGGLLGQLGGGSLLDNVHATQPTDVGLGNNVLGQIFGSKDVSRAVAGNAAAQSGLDPALLRKMLPIVAMMAAGYMARQHAGGGGAAATAAATGGGLGGLGGLLGGLLGGAGRAAAAPQQSAGGLGSLLDLNGDGNPLDDIMGMAGKLMR
jgi:hypothetical protein